MDAQWGRVPAVFSGERPSVVLCVVHDVEVAHLVLCVRPGHQVWGEKITNLLYYKNIQL